MKLLLFLIAMTFAAAASAQSGERGSIPPGTSQDGSRPADGAIKGGAILPGESAGIPQKTPSKCAELQGSLREDCLKQERDAGAGGTKEPRILDGEPRILEAPSAPRTKSPERAD